MTTAERRLEAVTGGLTAKERAVLFIRPPLRDEGESDERIRRLCPPDQAVEFERLVDVVTRANYDLSRLLETWCEWLTTTISELAWLESLHTAADREKVLRQALGEEGVDVRTESQSRRRRRGMRRMVVLPEPPPSSRGLEREMPAGMGARWEPCAAAGWAELPAVLAGQLCQNVRQRWQEAVAMELALAELAERFGEDVFHHEGRRFLDACRGKALELNAVLVAMGYPSSIDEPTEEQLAFLREWAHVDEVEPKAAETPRPTWLAQRESAEREALEAELLQQVRGGKLTQEQLETAREGAHVRDLRPKERMAARGPDGLTDGEWVLVREAERRYMEELNGPNAPVRRDDF